MEQRQIHVLQVIHSMNMGGAENMIMNLYRSIDREVIQFDFLVHSNEKGIFEDEIEKLGGKIYRAPYYKIIEDVTQLLHNTDKYVSIERYGVGKMFKKTKVTAEASEMDKVERDAYIIRPENVKIVCIREEKSDGFNLNLVEYVDCENKKVDYSAGQKLYDKAFMDAQTKAEEKYGL